MKVSPLPTSIPANCHVFAKALNSSHPGSKAAHRTDGPETRSVIALSRVGARAACEAPPISAREGHRLSGPNGISDSASSEPDGISDGIGGTFPYGFCSCLEKLFRVAPSPLGRQAVYQQVFFDKVQTAQPLRKAQSVSRSLGSEDVRCLLWASCK